MARGFVYLCADVDWFSRRVLSWRLSITPQAAFCVEAAEEGLVPNILIRPGLEVYLCRFTAVLKKAEFMIWMKGKGAWWDGVFVEPLCNR